MKNLFSFTAVFALTLFTSCGDQTPIEETKKDSVAENKLPDSVPQPYRYGKKADWAYKPDSAIVDLVIGRWKGLKDFTYENAAEGIDGPDGTRTMMYTNSQETELVTLFTVDIKGHRTLSGFRLVKLDDKKSIKLDKVNISVKPNFITNHGIYIGMPYSYVTAMYKSQYLMTWTKGDTTYLTYVPAEKDDRYFVMYPRSAYKCTYKFVNDKCRWIETIVDPKAIKP
jgi:hypothetical protein